MASREGFNLRRRTAWRFLWDRIRYRRHIPWRYVFEDTFMPLVCAMRGHRIYNAGMGTPEYACCRCHTWQKEPPPGELWVRDLYGRFTPAGLAPSDSGKA